MSRRHLPVSATLAGGMACLGAAIAACSLAPRYSTPSSAPPAQTYQESGAWVQAEPLDAASRGAWWSGFDDPRLDELEAKVGTANQSLKAAFARLEQARAATRIARADYLPTLSGAASATRNRASVNFPTFPPGVNPVFGDYTVSADLSYELDLFGRIRNAVASARAEQQASAADLATLDLALRAELATDHFALRAADAQQDLLDRTVEDYRRALQLTENLYKGGGAALADVEQARAQLESARPLAADVRLQRAPPLHAIAVLVGENPTGFRLDPDPLPLAGTPPMVDPGLPSTLLERRPDVAAAERRVVAANATIGIARAAYFPVFSLSAVTGFQSTQAATWLNAPSRLWSVGPSGVLTVFDAGRHRAENAQARAAYDEQVANYRGTVLTAYQEVEDSLAAIGQLRQEAVSEAAAVSATTKALEQSRYRYKAGLVTYLEVATNESNALQAQLSCLGIQLRLVDASVQLVKALGGGWQTPGPGTTAAR